MRFEHVSIASVGYELPPNVLTTSAIEDRLSPLYERLGLLPGRIELMTGIRERRYWSDEMRPSTVASLAGEQAISRASLSRDAIGCLVHASVCRDFLEPATANVVHDRLKLPPSCLVFDVSNACLGVLNGALIVADMIELGRIDAGLVVAGEIGKPLLDSTIARLLEETELTRREVKKDFASLTIGSGASALLLARSELLPADERHRLIGGSARAATHHHALCEGREVSGREENRIRMETDSEALLEAGVGLARENFALFRHEVGWAGSDIDRVITHQVGRAHHRALFDALSLDQRRSFVTYDRLGNIGSASLPVGLGLAEADGLLRRGERIALLGIGSGLSSIMLGVTW